MNLYEAYKIIDDPVELIRRNLGPISINRKDMEDFVDATNTVTYCNPDMDEKTFIFNLVETALRRQLNDEKAKRQRTEHIKLMGNKYRG